MDKALLSKSFDFAIRVIEMNRYICDEGKRFMLEQRLLECGTGIGANVRQAVGAHKKVQTEKLNTALCNAKECEYMLEIMVQTNFLTEPQSKPIRNDCGRLKEMLTSAVKEKI